MSDDAPRRLLWVNHFAVAPDMGGGTRHIEIARELVRLGWQVTVAASDFHLHGRAYQRRRDASDRATISEMIDGVEMRWLWASPYTRNDLKRVGNWLSFSRSLLRDAAAGPRPDVVIGSTPHLFAALAAQRLARRARAPFVLEVRDLWPESLAVGGRGKGPGYAGLWALARFLYRVARRIIVLAQGAGDYLVRSGVPARKIVFVPNGVDVSAFAGEKSPPRDALRLVYAGAHGPANGLDLVLDAAALLRDEPGVSWLLVGDGPSKAALLERAGREGLTSVQFADPVSKAAMPALLRECDAGLMILKELPLFSFGVSPNKLFDYWGASLPVVCNVAGEVARWVDSAGGGVQAADGSAAAIAAAVRELLARTPVERSALGDRGREYVVREHDRPFLASRVDATLRDVMQRRP